MTEIATVETVIEGWVRMLNRDDAISVQEPCCLVVMGVDELPRQVVAQQLVRELAWHGGGLLIDWSELMDLSVEVLESPQDAVLLAGSLTRRFIRDALDRSVHCVATFDPDRLDELRHLLERCSALRRPVTMIVAGSGRLPDGVGELMARFEDTQAILFDLDRGVVEPSFDVEPAAAPFDESPSTIPSEVVTEDPVPMPVLETEGDSAGELDGRPPRTEDEYVEIRRGNSVIRVRKPRAKPTSVPPVNAAESSGSGTGADPASGAAEQHATPKGPPESNRSSGGTAPRSERGSMFRMDAARESDGESSRPRGPESDLARQRLEQIERIRRQAEGG